MKELLIGWEHNKSRACAIISRISESEISHEIEAIGYMAKHGIKNG